MEWLFDHNGDDLDYCYKVVKMLQQSLVERVCRNGLSTHPCGTTVLMVSTRDVVEPNLGALNLSLRKSRVKWIILGVGGG